MKKHSLLLGAHMSIAGGIQHAFERGESIGCTVMQIFTKSNRQWHAKALTDKDISLFADAWKQSSIQSVVTHATYLINIGSPDTTIEKKSTDALAMELERSAALEIPYFVLHPGSHGNTDEESCIDRISSNLNKILKHAPKITVLLEIMAGQGSSVGYKFEHIAEIIKQSDFKRQLGVCLDTCHAFAAGYDFRTEKTYKTMWEEFDKIIGLNKLKALHLNDSKTDLGSHVDRHAHIGKGKIGLKAFELLMNDHHLFDVPKILETPADDLNDYKHDMEILKNLLDKKTKDVLHYKK